MSGLSVAWGVSCAAGKTLCCAAMRCTALRCTAPPSGTGARLEEPRWRRGRGGRWTLQGRPAARTGRRDRRMGGSEGRNRLAGDGTTQRRKRGLVRQDKRRSKRPRVVWKNENWSRLIDGGEGGHGREPSGGVHAATTEVLVFSG